MQDSATVSQTALRIQRPELSEFLIRRTCLELRRGAIRSEAMERDRHACATVGKSSPNIVAKTVDASTVRHELRPSKKVPAELGARRRPAPVPGAIFADQARPIAGKPAVRAVRCRREVFPQKSPDSAPRTRRSTNSVLVGSRPHARAGRNQPPGASACSLATRSTIPRSPVGEPLFGRGGRAGAKMQISERPPAPRACSEGALEHVGGKRSVAEAASCRRPASPIPRRKGGRAVGRAGATASSAG